jgi:hypothetical protein
VLSRVPAAVGSTRNSMATLIHPGCDQARRAAASRRGGAGPPSRRHAWLRPAEITTWGGRQNSTGMGVTSRKVRPASGWCRRPASHAGSRRMLSRTYPRGRAQPAPPRWPHCRRAARCDGPAVVLAHLHSNQQLLTAHETGAAGIHDLLRRVDPDPMKPPRSLTQPLGHSLHSQWCLIPI